MYGFDGHNEHLAARLEAFQDSGPTDLAVAPDGAATAAWTYRDGDPQFVLRVEAGGSSGIPSVSVHEVVYGGLRYTHHEPAAECGAGPC
jgi:hypothetical protein